MEIHVVLFEGIPQVAFYSRNGLRSYLKREGTSLRKIGEYIRNGQIPDWEVHTIEVK
jgi:hypothetical protein